MTIPDNLIFLHVKKTKNVKEECRFGPFSAPPGFSVLNATLTAGRVYFVIITVLGVHVYQEIVELFNVFTSVFRGYQHP